MENLTEDEIKNLRDRAEVMQGRWRFKIKNSQIGRALLLTPTFLTLLVTVSLVFFLTATAMLDMITQHTKLVGITGLSFLLLYPIHKINFKLMDMFSVWATRF